MIFGTCIYYKCYIYLVDGNIWKITCDVHFVVREEARGWILATLSDNMGTALVRDTVMCKVYREQPMCSLTFNVPDSVRTTSIVNSFSLFSFTDAIFLSYMFENIL